MWFSFYSFKGEVVYLFSSFHITHFVFKCWSHGESSGFHVNTLSVGVEMFCHFY